MNNLQKGVIFGAGFNAGYNSGSEKGPDDFSKMEKRNEKDYKKRLLKESGRSSIRGSAMVAAVEKTITGKTAEQKALLEEYVKTYEELFNLKNLDEDQDFGSIRAKETRLSGLKERLSKTENKYKKREVILEELRKIILEKESELLLTLKQDLDIDVEEGELIDLPEE
jgi:hypothetical protein